MSDGWKLKMVRRGLCEACGKPPGINPRTRKPYRLCKAHRASAALAVRRHYASRHGLPVPPLKSELRSVTSRVQARRELTVAQLDWLRHAQQMGYERGFISSPIKSLCDLERLGLIERDPTTSGKSTHWRITDLGERTELGKG